MEPKSKNIVWSPSSVSPEQRRGLLGHGAATLWFTGLSGSGKSTLAGAVEQRLVDEGACAYALDGDNVRAGLSADLGFGEADRGENIRRIGEVARLFNDAGVIVLTAFISPYRADRQRVRDILPEGAFIEVFVDCPLEICEERDVKGLYRRARSGEIDQFTGVSAPYEPPLAPDVHLPTGDKDVQWCVDAVMSHLRSRNVLG